jgi:hypothetical protein
MEFELDEIRAVFFRCNECRTAVSFPRIRWARLPERCPNCGANWMREPSTELTFSEEATIRAYQAANAFRDALQTLVAVGRTSRFTIGLEIEEQTEKGSGSAGHSRPDTIQKVVHGGKVKAVR